VHPSVGDGFPCPRCGHRPLAELRYGLLECTPELQADMRAGRVVPAGCTSDEDPPVFACVACAVWVHRDGRAAESPSSSVD
jgi:hypothetical protein